MRKNLFPLVILALCICTSIFVATAHAAIYAIDNTLSVSIKYNNGEPTLTETFMRVATGKTMKGEVEFEVAPVDPEKEMINVIAITKDGITKKKNIQTPQTSNIYISSPSEDVVNVAQTTTEPGYPVLELYWDYDKSPSEPWRYYMRVNNPDDGYAVLSDFRTKEVWRKPITSTRVNEIINSGTIPAWGSL